MLAKQQNNVIKYISKNNYREIFAFYTCISPWLIGFLIFTIGPMIASLILGFTKWDLLSSPKFIGIQNFKEMLTSDRYFWQSLKVTFIYSFTTVPLGLIFSLCMALLMNADVKGITIYRTIFYLPSVVSGVAVAVLWMWIFNPDFGLINTLLSKLGIHGPGWITDPKWALPALIIMSFWGVGSSAIIFLAGLKNIPKELYEAAEIDGASYWKQFVKITLPQLSPTIFFNLIMSIIGAFQTFTQSYVMTNGGPDNSTLFYNLYLYQNAFVNYRMGYAAAMAWILFIIILLLSLFVIKTSPAWVYYESERR